jgi:hypothetical protein
MVARGEAIAVCMLRDLEKDNKRGFMLRHLADIMQLAQAGRTGFRVAVNKELAEWSKALKTHKETPQFEAVKKAKAVMGARLSESVAFSKAIDAGMLPSHVKDAAGIITFTDGYAAIIAWSRVALNSQSSNGPTVRRGRVAKPMIEKVRAYILSLNPSPADYLSIDELVQDMAVSAVAVEELV